MKKLSLLLALAVVTTFSVFAGGNNTTEEVDEIIAIAEEAARDCSKNAGILTYDVETVRECKDGGDHTVVTIWAKPVCPPGHMCTAVITKVATVTLDCNNTVVSVECVEE